MGRKIRVSEGMGKGKCVFVGFWAQGMPPDNYRGQFSGLKAAGCPGPDLAVRFQDALR